YASSTDRAWRARPSVGLFRDMPDPQQPHADHHYYRSNLSCSASPGRHRITSSPPTSPGVVRSSEQPFHPSLTFRLSNPFRPEAQKNVPPLRTRLPHRHIADKG